jgi:UDPglucose--hexose-1-phosphate uridylyltransferase
VPELREDPLTGAVVILAPGRALRPDTFRASGTPTAITGIPASCPFCPGKEEMTPPEVYRTGTGAPQARGWQVRVVPNLYPIVGDGVPGAHEVAVLSPDHARSFAELDDDAAAEVLVVLRDRCAHHLARGLVHAQAFVNHGRAAGASIEHPHAQLVAVGFVPPKVASAQHRFASAGRDLVDATRRDAERAGVVVLPGDVAAWCPVASVSPYEIVLAHAGAGARFDAAPDEVVAAVGRALRRALGAMHTVLGDVPYNVVVHTAPATVDPTGEYHWYVEVTPRLTVTAGFEDATGVFVNVVAPELAANELREAIAS